MCYIFFFLKLALYVGKIIRPRKDVIFLPGYKGKSTDTNSEYSIMLGESASM